MIYICLFVSIFLLICIRILFICFRILNNRNTTNNTLSSKQSYIKTSVVVGAGGHGAEMLRLLSALDSKVYVPRQYYVAKSDTTSTNKILSLEKEIYKSVSREFTITQIPRSREVKQSWISSLFTTAISVIYVFPLLLRDCPDLVLCNGPGTCIPICFWCFLLKVLWIKNVTIIYIESICRVHSLSLSAKMLYFFADYILVQWSQLKQKYPYTMYIGRLV